MGVAAFNWQPSDGDGWQPSDGAARRFDYWDPRRRPTSGPEGRGEYMSYGETRTRSRSRGTRWRPWCAPGGSGPLR